jgi:hypothetical protein
MRVVCGKSDVYVYIDPNDETSEDISLELIDLGGQYNEKTKRWVFPLQCNKEVKEFVDNFNNPRKDEDVLRSSDEEIDQDFVPLLVRTELDKRRKKLHRASSPHNSDNEDEDEEEDNKQ